jgi:hypothetical protein
VPRTLVAERLQDSRRVLGIQPDLERNLFEKSELHPEAGAHKGEPADAATAEKLRTRREDREENARAAVAAGATGRTLHEY